MWLYLLLSCEIASHMALLMFGLECLSFSRIPFLSISTVVIVFSDRLYRFRTYWNIGAVFVSDNTVSISFLTKKSETKSDLASSLLIISDCFHPRSEPHSIRWCRSRPTTCSWTCLWRRGRWSAASLGRSPYKRRRHGQEVWPQHLPFPATEKRRRSITATHPPTPNHGRHSVRRWRWRWGKTAAREHLEGGRLIVGEWNTGPCGPGCGSNGF